jgi:hypothetical protein
LLFKLLTQLIADGMVQTRETPTGDVLVVAESNGNSQGPQTKEEIIAEKYAHLRKQLISASDASRKYSGNTTLLFAFGNQPVTKLLAEILQLGCGPLQTIHT